MFSYRVPKEIFRDPQIRIIQLQSKFVLKVEAEFA